MKLKDLRQRAGYSQAELAEKMGVAQTTLSSWELGRFDMSPKMKQKAAAIFNVSPGDIENQQKMAPAPYDYRRLIDAAEGLENATYKRELLAEMADIINILTACQTRENADYIIEAVINMLRAANDLLVEAQYQQKTEAQELGAAKSYHESKYIKYYELLSDEIKGLYEIADDILGC